MEITLEKIELVKDRTGVSYKEAKDALEAADGSVVDAIIAIEETVDIKKSGKTNEFVGETMDKIKELVKKGNISKIAVKKGDETIVNIPVNVGVVGAIVAPWGVIAAAIATVGFKCRVELTTTDGKVIDISKRAEGFAGDMKEKGSVVFDGVLEKGTGVVNSVKEKAPEVMNDVMEKGVGAYNTLKDAAADKYSEFKAKKENAAEEAEEEADDIADAVSEAASDICEKAGEVLESAAEAAAEAAEKVKEKSGGFWGLFGKKKADAEESEAQAAETAETPAAEEATAAEADKKPEETTPEE